MNSHLALASPLPVPPGPIEGPLGLAERALKEAEARFGSVMENLPDGVILYELDRRISYVNPAVERVTRRPLSALKGRLLSELWPDASGELTRVLERTFSSGRRQRVEASFHPPGGSPLLLQFNLLPVKGQDGQVRQVLCTARDITLERWRMKELAHREAAAREADRMKGEFLAMLSHELRNPLTPIRSSLYVLDRVLPGTDAAQRAKAVIARQSEHLAKLVDDLLEYARMSRGKVRLRRDRQELSELVRRTCEDHRLWLEQRSLSLRVLTPAMPVWVEADGTRLVQVLGNLLHNAGKFTPHGGEVTVVLSTDGHRVQLRVRDTGLGIAPELLLRIFEPFVQAHYTLARTDGGLGLGLAVVKAVVERHGGWVSARSQGPGQGAEFVLELPVAPAVVEASAAGRPPPF